MDEKQHVIIEWKEKHVPKKAPMPRAATSTGTNPDIIFAMIMLTRSISIFLLYQCRKPSATGIVYNTSALEFKV